MSQSPDLQATSEPGSGELEEREEPMPDGEEEAEDDEYALSLREISPLASWTVSTYKPGCGVTALLNPSTAQFWQSDGPQPHLLNIHFFKLVTIARLRVYLDLELDESYTPTRMVFLAGHSEYDVVEFAEWRAPTNGEGPQGWEEISLENCVSPDDASDDNDSRGEATLRCMFLQIRVLENHQNGKDTHIRGVQVWAHDERDERMAKPKLIDYSVGKEGNYLSTDASWHRLDPYLEGDFGKIEIR